MPFQTPFTRALKVGDLIYGLHAQRVHYIKQYPPFKSIKYSQELHSYTRAVTIDQFIIPAEKTFPEWPDRYKYMHKTKQYPYHKSFTSHISNHPKYHTSYKTTPESKGKIFSRKCKAGLSWITMSNGDLDLVKNNNVHFILDGIDMRYVVKKIKYAEGKTDITAHELRWIYRNRNNINVQNKIQFWLNGQPTSPPWENDEGKMIWRLYTPKSEIEEVLNSSLSIYF
ncbi:hypothetical protein [Xenorhabdus innexi]|uniref:T3SS effector EspK n=1 Tax=Xenorhabdus innexi TaxID=290109 RepID=A0A1N6MX81_9GAMM|nr:hypothetical protein [Xenorhabdus innexi]PHM30342.1 T3SS effector EspK [Xenorhabdus innexi]SIP73422.1 hypothetical protein XIS1_210006 [Xenorhabdus innexi]